jgi:6-pyruvoyltetrahydropterin/6-carboxytetrahydropterin synthase
MYEIFKELFFSASHQLRGYKGKCERLHGHNWRVRIHLSSPQLDECGMVMDFNELEKIMLAAIEPFDHHHLNDIEPFDTINPSSENLARVICDRVHALIGDRNLKIRFCDVWESDFSRARYIPEE